MKLIHAEINTLTLFIFLLFQAVSQKDTPHNNFFFYNGTDGGGLVDKIG